MCEVSQGENTSRGHWESLAVLHNEGVIGKGPGNAESQHRIMKVSVVLLPAPHVYKVRKGENTSRARQCWESASHNQGVSGAVTSSTFAWSPSGNQHGTGIYQPSSVCQPLIERCNPAGHNCRLQLRSGNLQEHHFIIFLSGQRHIRGSCPASAGNCMWQRFATYFTDTRVNYPTCWKRADASHGRNESSVSSVKPPFPAMLCHYLGML